MNKAIIGRKVGMTRLFAQDGKMIPVTVVEAGPCPVVQVKTAENDGYSALKLGFIETSEKALTKPELGQFKKANVKPCKVLKEIRVDNAESYKAGDELKADVFAAGDKVDVSGVTKGHGFTGVIKRWNARRLKETHGSGPVVRHGGSIGACSDPSRVFKGKKMAGHLGAERVTVQNLTVVKVDAENNLIAIKGAVPGPNGGTVIIRDSIKA